MTEKEQPIVELSKSGEIRARGYWAYFIQAENLFFAAVDVRPLEIPTSQKEGELDVFRIAYIEMNNQTGKTLLEMLNKDYYSYELRIGAKRADEHAYNQAKIIAGKVASLLEYKIRDQTLEEPFIPAWRSLTQRIVMD